MPPTLAQGAHEQLGEALTAYARLLPGSAAEHYLLRRGIPVEVSISLGRGLAPERAGIVDLTVVNSETGEVRQRGSFRGRVVMPLSGPDGATMGSIGRASPTSGRPATRRWTHGAGSRPWSTVERSPRPSRPAPAW